MPCIWKWMFTPLRTKRHGLADGEWVPYLIITYTIEKVGTNFKRTGPLLPMTAGDSPHYANNVGLMGDGTTS